jgi:hypothetical protein
MLKPLSVAAMLAIAGTAFAQSTPSTTPSDTPSVTPSQTPAVTPSQTPAVTPSDTPTIAPQGTVVVPPVTTPSPSVGPAPAIGGLSKCENLLGTEKDKCLQDERSGTGSTGTAR